MADDLPTLNDYGLLPPGVHSLSLDAIEHLFAPIGSPQRRMLFQRLKEYLQLLSASRLDLEVLVDGSFVMPKVDGNLGPSDIDILLVMPESWSAEVNLPPAEYNLLSTTRLRRKYHFHVFTVAGGSEAERDWTEYFSNVNPKWCKPLSLPQGSKKGIVKVTR